MKVSGSRPVFPHFDYLTTRQLTNRPDCCQLQPAGCLLLFALCAMRFAPCAPRPLVSVSPCLRASLSPVLRFSRSPFPLLHAWAPLLLRSRDCQLPAACCQLSAGLDRCRLSLSEIGPLPVPRPQLLSCPRMAETQVSQNREGVMDGASVDSRFMRVSLFFGGTNSRNAPN